MKRRPWTPAEDAVIRERYPTASAAEVAELIQRSIKSVWTRASELGVHKNPAWIAERARIRSLAPNHGARHQSIRQAPHDGSHFIKQRVCQAGKHDAFVSTENQPVEANSLTDTERGDGGFGSTGSN